jgi:hypothetical protein
MIEDSEPNGSSTPIPTVQNDRHRFQCTDRLVEIKGLLPVELFRAFSYVSISTHNPINVYFSWIYGISISLIICPVTC